MSPKLNPFRSTAVSPTPETDVQASGALRRATSAPVSMTAAEVALTQDYFQAVKTATEAPRAAGAVSVRPLGPMDVLDALPKRARTIPEPMPMHILTAKRANLSQAGRATLLTACVALGGATHLQAGLPAVAAAAVHNNQVADALKVGIAFENPGGKVPLVDVTALQVGQSMAIPKGQAIMAFTPEKTFGISGTSAWRKEGDAAKGGLVLKAPTDQQFAVLAWPDGGLQVQRIPDWNAIQGVTDDAARVLLVIVSGLSIYGVMTRRKRESN